MLGTAALQRVALPFIFSLVAFAAAVIFTPAPAEAQSAAAGIGLRPATIEEPIEPGQSYNYTVNVSNLSNTTQTYYIFTRNITGVRPGGVPIFADESVEETGFEVTSWIDLEVEEITVGPEEEKPIPFTVTVPADASPGSHFGGVFVSIEPPRLRSIGASVGYEVATILSLQVAGDAVESARIRSFATDNYIYSENNVTFRARIENLGNTLIRPVGPLEINNMFGNRVALITFNDTKAGIFPNSTREFEIAWEGDGSGFGRYEAVLSAVYGSDGGQATISSIATYWILPMDIIGPAALILLILLLVVYVAIKLYVRRRLSGIRRARRVAHRGGTGASLTLIIMIVMLVVTALFLIILLALFA